MQPRPTQTKPKYRIKDFAATGNHATNKTTFLPKKESCKLYCICNQFQLAKAVKCTRCNQSYHSCVANKIQSRENWECLHCLSKYMDPIYVPETILIETFFKTESVYQYANIFEFVFNLTAEQLKNPVEIRGLQDGRNGLAWPMHGQFHLNRGDFDQCIIDFKPLLKNSNRKNRKEEAIILPAERLVLGRNVLTFYIPKLNMNAYEAKYQVQKHAVYFLGVYAIKKLSKEELIQKTFATSKIDKTSSLQLLRKLTLKEDPELSVEKVKLCLECPYMKSRIKIPIRGKKCYHYMVICLDTLIQTRAGMNSRQWLCPICSFDINEPVIDMFILSILNDGSAGIEVMLSVTGEYQWVAFEEDNISLSSDSESIKNIHNKQIQEKKPIQKISSPSKQPITQNKQPIKAKNEKMTEKSQKSKEQKPITTIDLDDDDSPPAISANVVQLPARKSVAPPRAKSTSLEIPEEKKKFNKEKQLSAQREKLKQTLKQMKKPNEQEFARVNPKKDQFLITDVKELEFKSMTFNEFIKRYFNFEYNRAKINEDLRIIFRDVV